MPEHELFAASEDVEARVVETLAKKYLSLLHRLRWIQYILYGSTALICPICSLAVGHTLDWFWLVLTGELVGVNLTLLLILVEQYRGAITLGGFTLSLELLLLVACLFSGGDWFLLASAGVLLGPGAVSLPGTLRELSRPLREHKAVLCPGAETLLLYILPWISCVYNGADWFPTPTLSVVLFGLTLPWAWVLACRHAPISRQWKEAVCLEAACVFLPLVNPMINRPMRLGGGTTGQLHGFWFQSGFTQWVENWYFSKNVLLLLWLALVVATALYALRALLCRQEA